jgi:hypothetical protein
MKWLALLLLVACSNADGTRGQCAEGGELAACPEAERTAEGACWRLVDCGAIPLKRDENPDGSPNFNIFDWDNCVGDLESGRTDSERVAIDCIAAATCDSLKTDNPRDPDPSQIACLVAAGLE